MPEVIQVVGYHNSGKTTLVRALARELMGRSYQVAAVKHLSHHFDIPGKDTAVLAETAGQVGFISPQGAGVLWRKPVGLEELISHLEADVILVEGFKGENKFPRIVCLRGEPDDRDLFDGPVLCAVGPAGQVEGVQVPLFGPDEVGEIADLVEHSWLRRQVGD